MLQSIITTNNSLQHNSKEVGKYHARRFKTSLIKGKLTVDVCDEETTLEVDRRKLRVGAYQSSRLKSYGYPAAGLKGGRLKLASSALAPNDEQTQGGGLLSHAPI